METEEMFRVFNMGIGMILAVDPAGLAEVLGFCAPRARRAGSSAPSRAEARAWSTISARKTLSFPHPSH